MYLDELFRSFLPLRNPVGFGVADFVVFAGALLLALSLFIRALLLPWWRRIAPRTGLVMVLLALLTVSLRLILLPASPAPVPAGADDFSYVLLGDTLAHGRLANPTHPLHEFFETVFVLQQPTYSSIFPLGQGLVLAAGRLLFGAFWAGVLLSSAALVALCFWMLRGWLAPGWALAGSLVALFQLGPLCQWTNSFWGGAVSACAGCLVFGSLPRLASASRRESQYSALLGIGFAAQLLTRPFETVLLALVVLLYWLMVARPAPSSRAKFLLCAVLPVALAFGLTLLQNKRVTGAWNILPYVESRYQYGVPATFTFQPNAVPHRTLTPEQDLDYRAQAAIHGFGGETFRSYCERLAFRLRFLRFFLPAPLYLAALFFLPNLRERRWCWAAAAVVLFLIGTNFYPYFFPHYIAAIGCLLLLVAAQGLQTLSEWRLHGSGGGAVAALYLLCLCAAQFAFWFGVHASSHPALLAATDFESWDFIDFGDPEGRRAIASQLAHSPGAQLVFVHYGPRHRFGEWIANRADIDGERTVWARDEGVTENEELLRYFPRRKAWLLEPDEHPPRLTPYAGDGAFEPVR